MKIQKTMLLRRFGLMLVLLCSWGLPQLAGAAPLISQVPTGPRDINGNWATPDYNTTANWANSPPMAKFVDTLPGLGSGNKNNLGQYLSLGKPDTVTYPGSDYYEIDLIEYRERMHSDLPAPGTLLRGYIQVNKGTDTASCGGPAQPPCSAAYNTLVPDPVHYLGPSIVARRDRPVRIKFTNRLPVGAAGDLFIPVDTTVMGAGSGPAYPGALRGQGANCDNTMDGNTCASYTQNRATLHLHGGRTPWISDGTPHQWITPKDENTPYPQGVSVQNVPDMPDPGDGSMTFYYSNQQSARLMFYHDHAFGITRLNVYAGEAAGYVITDQYEQDLVTRGLLPPDQIPLIIQDKTFVDASEIRKYDPLWNWGSGTPDANGVRQPVEGDLWMPHVYMPAQTSVAGFGGVNPFGRWMYGPWFYPATVVAKGPVLNPYYDPNCSSPDPAILATCQTPGQPSQIPGTPHPSMGMEAFQDSAVVNGTVFPSLTVDPRAYRFRILNAASDRFWNLSFYQADPNQVSPDPRPASPLTEVRMLPASAELAAQNNWPALWPVDGRDGGVPDPAFKGPSFLQIGTEGGFLPKPVVIEPQPITYITDPTAFWVGNVDKMGLALGPAERADVVVDFSAYAGKTLILYNDAPAAWPARVANYDYYTGAPDSRDSGGYGAGGVYDPASGTWVGGHGVLPGYAPNTRTVMQVVVRSTPQDQPYSFSPAALQAEFVPASPAVPSLFAKAQEPIIVGQAAYKDVYPDSYFPPNFPWEGISQINDSFLQFVTVENSTAVPKHVIAPMEPKGLHDEMGASFDPVYGRMSGNLGMQLPNPTTLNALLVLYGFSDLPTETINNSTSTYVTVLNNTLTDGTQIWKISHNGVDTHPIHFHIFDVQLINRVGWDGQILLPEPNELGWKDTVKISPLEDTIVAVRPRAPLLPFGIPNSLRPLNPAIPLDSPMGFSSIDWQTGQAYAAPSPYAGGVTNIMYNFGWEYVWHCHILSHEEMDMMRPIVLNVPSTLPDAPLLNSVSAGGVLAWSDSTPAADPGTPGNPRNEIGFTVQRCESDCTNPGSFATIGKAPANATSYADTSVSASSSYSYRVVAYNSAGPAASNIIDVDTGSLVKPTVSISAPAGGATVPFGTLIRVDASASANGALTVAKVDFYVNGVLFGSDSSEPFSYDWVNATPGSHVLTAVATDSNGVVSPASSAVTITVNRAAAPATISVPVGSATGTYTISWTASATTGATYVLEESATAAFATSTVIPVGNAGSDLSVTISGKADSTAFYYRVKAVFAGMGDSAWTSAANGCVVSYPTSAPASISVPVASTNGVYTVSWSVSTTLNATYTLEESTTADFNTSTPVVSGLTTTFREISGKITGTYYYRVKAVAAGFSTFPWTVGANGCTVALAQATVSLPGFSQPLLTKESQTPWENVIPNALADYFTYVPYTTADAVKVGFPASCGNLAKGDSSSTEDCYTITVKKFAQQLAVPGIFGGGPGLRGANGAALGAATSVYGYGSGGSNWTLPYYDTTKPGVVAGTTVTGNAPAPFADGTLSTAGIWHFPAPTIKGRKGRPVRVQWLNELPNEAPTGLDPSLDCGPNAPDCFPYNRIVTHVHGAHVGPESDGLPSAWFTPGFAVKGEDFVSTRQHGPEGTYYYPMDQEASTVWYHDHAMGTTHNNVNMGMAGFFPITDANEQSLIAGNILPSGAYELGFALQDRHFTASGQLAMPDYPIYDLNSPGCTMTADGLADPLTCTRINWMKDPADGHFVPYQAGHAFLTDPINTGAPFGAPSATLEYFGNMPVVNGVVYGKTNVEPRVYRMRFIGGSDSRTWVMQLKRSDNNAIIPFWVTGSDQGLLNNPVQRQEVDLMPGERVDVLVDFTAIPAGTRIMMNNLGGDSPWSGYYDYQAGNIVPSVDIPEIMAFDVNLPLNATIPNTVTPAAGTALRQAIQALTPANTRVVSLIEITDGFGRTMPTIDSRGFKPVGIPVTEIIKLGDVEQWDIVNTTVDAHPIHLHQVAFQVIDRQALTMDALGNVTGFTPPADDIVNQVFIPPTYTAAGLPIAPDAWDAGWKDTVASPPGYVTRVRAKFDITGDYVWHCHILSHEEHDMMRPFTVTDAAFTAPAPVSIAVPAASVSGSYTVSWIGTAIAGVSYELQEATDPAGPYSTVYSGTAPRFDLFNKPTGSTFFYQVRALATAGFASSPWRTGANGCAVTRTVITAPLNGASFVQGTPATIDAAAAPTAPAGTTVSKVEFFANGLLVGMDTSAPFSTPWTPGTTGTHNLTAIAYYSNNVTSSSAVVTVTVSAVVPPITLDAPTDGAVFELGTAIPLAATPSAVSGAFIFIVEFFDGTTPVGYDFTPPYNSSYTPATAGAHSLTAKAYYSNGATATSATTVVTLKIAPPASLTVPTTNATGSYTVTWTPSTIPTPGETYVLEESTMPGFAVGTTNVVASGSSATSAVITGKLNGTYYYRVKAVKTGLLDSVWVNGQCVVTIPPPTGSILINGGATATGSSTVTLTLSASSPIVVSQMQFSKDGGTTWTQWETYSTTRTVTLTPTGDGLKTVSVRYKDAAGSISIAYTDSITLDKTPPTGTILINGGAATTASATVTLAMSANDANGVTSMQFSKDGGTTWTPWETYSTTRNFTLAPAGDGLKTVSVRYKDTAGTISVAYTVSITLDKTPPTGTILINGGAATTASATVTLTMSANDANGVTSMQFSKDNVIWNSWEAYNTTRVANVLLPGAGTKTFYVRFKDSLGNISPVYSDTIDYTP